MKFATDSTEATENVGGDGVQEALAVLAQAPESHLSAAWAAWDDKPDYKLVRGPETGLVMVRGRTGGSGAPFNLGEATVTRATVRLSSGEIGHAYALGRDHEKALCGALFHALWQCPNCRERIENLVLSPLRGAIARADVLLRRETAATKVDFYTMVRGDD